MMDTWQQRALADPDLSESQVRAIMNGPQSLADAWILGALRLKYLSDEPRTTSGPVEKDSVLDDDLHDNDSLAIPQLHMKYMEFHNTYSLMKKERELELKRLLRDKWLYYKGKAPAAIYKEMPFDYKLTAKDEISMFIEADQDVQKVQYKLDYIEQVLFFLDGVLRMINSRTYHIKNAIEWKRFQSGM